MIITSLTATPALNVVQVTRACSPITAILLGLTMAAPPASALAPGADGVRVTIPVSGISDVAQAVAIDPNGNIVLAGSDGGAHSVLVRLTPSGALDLSFGSNGIAINDLSVNAGDALRALVRLDDGRYVGCGSFNNVTAGTGFDFVVARFNSNGSLDSSFAGGYAVTAFAAGSAPEQCNALAVQTGGQVVAAGVTTVAGHPHVALARYTTLGALDTSFGSGGLVNISAAANASGDSEARALLLQSDGKLLVAGYASGPGNSELLLMRLNANGSLDSSFGSGGITRTPVGSSEDIANAMVRQPDGRIVIAGSAIAADGRRDFALARYTSVGALDPTFGSGGLVTTPVGPSDDIANALNLMPCGRLVAAGSARIDTSTAATDLAVAAYQADGSLDLTFGIGGKRMVNISDFDDVVTGLATDLNGARFWAVGTAYGTLTTAQDFLAIEFGVPETIFCHGFESSAP